MWHCGRQVQSGQSVQEGRLCQGVDSSWKVSSSVLFMSALWPCCETDLITAHWLHVLGDIFFCQRCHAFIKSLSGAIATNSQRIVTRFMPRCDPKFANLFVCPCCCLLSPDVCHSGHLRAGSTPGICCLLARCKLADHNRNRDNGVHYLSICGEFVPGGRNYLPMRSPLLQRKSVTSKSRLSLPIDPFVTRYGIGGACILLHLWGSRYCVQH